MKRARSVPGIYISISVMFTLANGTIISYCWDVDTSSIQFGYAKAPQWGREEMAKEHVKGRSYIVSVAVTVRVVEGDYTALPAKEE